MSEPAPVLIGPNSELFGSKVHATKIKETTVLLWSLLFCEA
jgi:hypothetical protein